MVVWQKLLGLWHSEHNGTKGITTLAEVIDQARRDWLYAQNYYNTVTDPDLIDYALFLTKAYERRYMYLLRKVRQEGIRVSTAEFIETGTIRKMF